MRCFACNDELSDEEATHKSKITSDYLDLCFYCFSEVKDIFEEIAMELEQKESENEHLFSP